VSRFAQNKSNPNMGSSISHLEIDIDSKEVYKCSNYTLYNAKSKRTKEIVSVFVHPQTNVPPTETSNVIKRHKTLRHPGLVKYTAFHGEATKSIIVTEQVTTLSIAINDLSQDEICLGLYSLLVL
jgi:hypothetical protein